MSIEIEDQAAPGPGATPLVAGTIRGVRAWSLLVDGAGSGDFLGAIGRDVVWPRGRPMEARCVPGGEPPRHRAPQPGCTCGIYSHHPHRAVEALVGYRDHDSVLGVVEVWGRIEVHEDGFRAQRARPLALIADASSPAAYRRRVRRVAMGYGVEYVELDGRRAIAAHFLELEDAISAEAVEDLLADERELVLGARAEGYLTKRGRAVGGFGYWSEAMENPSPWKPRLECEMPGTKVVRVAGASHRAAALQAPEFSPGRDLRLLAEPTNLQDRNAVAVWDGSLRLRLGYVPRALASEVGRDLKAGRIGRVMSAWEWRDLRSGERFGLNILISRTRRVRLIGPGEQEELFEEEIAW